MTDNEQCRERSGNKDAIALAPLELSPIVDQSLHDLVYSSPETLLNLVDEYGSPLNLIWPHVLKKNVDTLRATLRDHGVSFELFYGAKVNKSQALVRAAVEAEAGIDVSSVYEMRDALRAGLDPSKLCATGPAKTAEFHAALIAETALISIDSVEEFSQIEEQSASLSSEHRVRVLLRYRPDSARESRFGMGSDGLLECLSRLAKQTKRFTFEGFHFHLSGYGHESRAQAVNELADYAQAARNLGLNPGLIDIGGGLPIRYVRSDEYEGFLGRQQKEGYRNRRVPESLYPYGSRIDASEWLNLLMASPCKGKSSIARFFKEQNLSLAIEPGRSLADQTAASAFRITCTKAMPDGSHVIFVEGSSFSACETWFSSEFLVDPVLVSASGGGETEKGPVRAYIAGHSCLDEDVLTNRLLTFSKRPEAGDLLVYANTAGYQMDLLENEFHRHPMPNRIAITCKPSGGIAVLPDDHTG